MKILALDQATHMGWVVYDDEEEEIIDYGISEMSGKDKYARAYRMYNVLKDIIIDNDIEKIVFEDVYYQNTLGIANYEALIAYKTVIFLLIYKYQLDYSIRHAATWRSLLDIKKVKQDGRKIDKAKRKDLKTEDIEFANKYFKLDLKSDDVADAFCILACDLEVQNGNIKEK